jgi:hypothetical protein
MKLTKLALIIFAVAVPLALAVNVCSAGSAVCVDKAWAGINPADDSGRVAYGSTVYIYWTGVQPSSSGDTVDVTVINPQGTTIAQWTDLSPEASGTKSFTADIRGTYAVVLDGNPTYKSYSTLVAASSIFVVPESAWGALMALATGLGAVTVFGVVKKKNNP